MIHRPRLKWFKEVNVFRGPKGVWSQPNNVSSMQSFLGLANYYQSFIPKMHDLRAPLNELLKKDKSWDWSTECQEEFDKIKEALTSDLFLTHFDSKLELIVACDASSCGVGACILHKMPNGTNKPIAYASKTPPLRGTVRR